jgi:predicted permease
MSTGDDPAGDLDDDLREHLALEIQARVDRGATPDAARAAALRALGSRARVREEVRAVWVPRWLDDGRQDLRYALRTLWRHRAFSVSAIATLGLAIGAATLMGALAQAVLWRPLPYPGAERLVTLWVQVDGQDERRRVGFDTVEAWRAHAGTLEIAGVLDGATATLNWPDGAERTNVLRAAPEVAGLLGIAPHRGRIFTAQEARDGRRLAVISHRLWRDRFASSDAAVGAPIVIDGQASEIIGVLPPRTALGPMLVDAEVLEPYSAAPGWRDRAPGFGAGPWTVLARLRPGISADAAGQELGAIARAASGPVDRLRSVDAVVVPLDEHLVNARTRLTLLTLVGAAGCMLAIALANIANLSLTRSIERLREIGLRASLGATPARLVRQLLVESLALTTAAGAAGAAVAGAALTMTPRLVADLARFGELRVGVPALAWTAALTLLSGIVLAAVPCLVLVGRSIGEAGAAATRATTAGVFVKRLRQGVLVGELALAVTLVAGAALLVRSWVSLTSVDPGFRSDRVFSLHLSTTSYDTPARRALFYAQVVDRLSTLPDVEAAGLVSDVWAGSDSDALVTVDDEHGRRRVRLRVRRDETTGGALEAIGASLRRGRMLSAEDHAEAPPAILVNEQFARRVWPGGEAIGRRITFDDPSGDPRWFTVVGIVGDMRRESLDRPPVAQTFEAVGQNPPRGGVLLVRSVAPPQPDLLRRIQHEIRRIDSQVPIYGVNTLGAQLDARQALRRAQTGTVVTMAVLALVLAAVGIYGVTLHAVTARTREIGIRVALGASDAHVLRATIGEGVRLCAIGIVLGLLGAIAAGRAARALLFGVGVADPLALGATIAVLVAVTLGACYVPARRAMRVNPIDALRES